MGQLKQCLCSAPCLVYPENNYIWTRDSPIIASVQAYTSSMTKTSGWSFMPAKLETASFELTKLRKGFAVHCVG